MYSEPGGALVYAKPIAAGQKVFLGKTPIRVNAIQIENDYGGGGPVYIEFIKQGYFPFRVYVTELSNMTSKISVELDAKTGLEDQEILNSVIESMFESQRLAKAKRYDHAIEELDRLQEKAPFLASVYEMRGGIYYIKQNYRAAYDNYMKAIKFNPKNADARRMISLLKSSFGFQHDIDPMDIDVERLPAHKKNEDKSKRTQQLPEKKKEVER